MLQSKLISTLASLFTGIPVPKPLFFSPKGSPYSSGEVVRANFGQRPFSFNFDVRMNPSDLLCLEIVTCVLVALMKPVQIDLKEVNPPQNLSAISHPKLFAIDGGKKLL